MVHADNNLIRNIVIYYDSYLILNNSIYHDTDFSTCTYQHKSSNQGRQDWFIWKPLFPNKFSLNSHFADVGHDSHLEEKSMEKCTEYNNLSFNYVFCYY